MTNEKELETWELAADLLVAMSFEEYKKVIERLKRKDKIFLTSLQLAIDYYFTEDELRIENGE